MSAVDVHQIDGVVKRCKVEGRRVRPVLHDLPGSGKPCVKRVLPRPSMDIVLGKLPARCLVGRDIQGVDNRVGDVPTQCPGSYTRECSYLEDIPRLDGSRQ